MMRSNVAHKATTAKKFKHSINREAIKNPLTAIIPTASVPH